MVLIAYNVKYRQYSGFTELPLSYAAIGSNMQLLYVLHNRVNEIANFDSFEFLKPSISYNSRYLKALKKLKSKFSCKV